MPTYSKYSGVGGGGGGTVTSVGLAAPGIFTVSGSPVTGAGTLTLGLATETANTVWAGPASGAAATPTFRALVAADLPIAGFNYLSSNTSVYGGTFSTLTFTGTQNVVVGVGAAAALTSGTGNTLYGYQSGAAINSAVDNTAIGTQALNAVVTGGQNTAVGAFCLLVNTGANNTAIGRTALAANTAGSGNVAIGFRAGGSDTSSSNAFYIGNVNQGSVANDKAFSLMYGTFAGSAGTTTGQTLAINVASGSFGLLGISSTGTTLGAGKQYDGPASFVSSGQSGTATFTFGLGTNVGLGWAGSGPVLVMGSSYTAFNIRSNFGSAQLIVSGNTGNSTGPAFQFNTTATGGVDILVSATGANNTNKAGGWTIGNSWVLGNGALSTSATDGFAYMPTSAGAPSGTPNTITGMAPFEIDTTNSKIMVYIGGVWKGVVVT